MGFFMQCERGSYFAPKALHVCYWETIKCTYCSGIEMKIYLCTNSLFYSTQNAYRTFNLILKPLNVNTGTFDMLNCNSFSMSIEVSIIMDCYVGIFANTIAKRRRKKINYVCQVSFVQLFERPRRKKSRKSNLFKNANI